MGKKVLISGYIGFSNFGDDVIFAILTRHLKAKGFEISALSSNPQKTKQQFKVNALAYKNPFEILKGIINCDYLISGGGTLLQNSTSNLSLFYYLFIILLAKLLFKKVIIFAQGVGPVEGNFWQKLTKFTLSVCDLVTVRDARTYKLLGNWQIKCSYTKDPAWDLPTVQPEGERYVGIQLRSCKNMHPDFIKVLARYVGLYFSERKIRIYQFQNSQDAQVCYEFEQAFHSQWPQTKCEIISNSSIKSLVQEFSNLDYLIAMRFHACLLGLKCNSRVLALSYDPKVESLANEFELQCIDVSRKPEDYNEKFRKLIEYSEHGDITKKRKTQFDWSAIDKFMLK